MVKFARGLPGQTNYKLVFMERILKGDLVSIKSSHLVGIVVAIVRRSDQNADWDLLSVMCNDGSIQELSPRKLIKKDQKE